MEYSNWYAGLLLLAAAVSCHQLLQYYQRHISPTPIVGTTVFDFLSGLVGDSSLGPKWYKDAYQKVIHNYAYLFGSYELHPNHQAKTVLEKLAGLSYRFQYIYSSHLGYVGIPQTWTFDFGCYRN